jgi:hypothetical protein
MTQLLIIGNGFDLQCGLKSSYKDFFECCIVDTIGGQFGLQQTKKGQAFGFWERLLLEYHKKYGSIDYKWCDIESIIKETLWLINFGANNAASPNPSAGLWRNATSCYDKNVDPSDEFENEQDVVKKYILTYCGLFFFNNLHPRRKKPDSEKRNLLNAHLLQELKKLEQRFCRHLRDNIIDPKGGKGLNTQYIINVINLIAKLTGFLDSNFKSIEDIIYQKDVQGWKQTSQNMRSSFWEKVNVLTNDFAKLSGIHILSFNYTALFDVIIVESPCVYGNVHGKLCLKKCDENCVSSSVIFGIDDTVIQSQNANDELRLFSKTYRKMFYTSAPTSILPPNDNKSLTIKFYGHSLNEADYSYFQSIFDYYNLYDNGKVDLIFYYSKGFEQTDAIYRLIHAYGKTLVNQNQGENLMHKLLLENRIKIVEVSL